MSFSVYGNNAYARTAKSIHGDVRRKCAQISELYESAAPSVCGEPDRGRCPDNTIIRTSEAGEMTVPCCQSLALGHYSLCAKEPK